MQCSRSVVARHLRQFSAFLDLKRGSFTRVFSTGSGVFGVRSCAFWRSSCGRWLEPCHCIEHASHSPLHFSASQTASVGTPSTSIGSGDSEKTASASASQQSGAQFAHLVCPLSKAPLQYAPTIMQVNVTAYTAYEEIIFICMCSYSESTSELINQELGVAYPVRGGIPVLIPRLGRTFEV